MDICPEAHSFCTCAQTSANLLVCSACHFQLIPPLWATFHSLHDVAPAKLLKLISSSFLSITKSLPPHNPVDTIIPSYMHLYALRINLRFLSTHYETLNNLFLSLVLCDISLNPPFAVTDIANSHVFETVNFLKSYSK